MELLGSENIHGNFLEVTSTLMHILNVAMEAACYILHFNLNYLKCTMVQLMNVGGGTYVCVCFRRNALFFTPEWGPLRLTPHAITLM